jgi:hypothetical protein
MTSRLAIELARETAKEVLDMLVRDGVLIPLIQMSDLEDKATLIIHGNYANLSPTSLPVVLSTTRQNSPSMPLSNVRRSRHRVVVR